jgi:hypothetical protein
MTSTTLTAKDMRLAALKYAQELGWAVLPLHRLTTSSIPCTCGKINCKSVAKHPAGDLVKHGVKDASTNAENIDWWFALFQNIGLAMGQPSGVWALDIDDLGELEKLEAIHGKLPLTPVQKTGSGGRHYLFQWSDKLPLANWVKVQGSPIDIRTTGGYIVAAPSLHQCGQCYTWLVDPFTTPVAEAPEWLMEWILKHGEQLGAATKPGHQRTSRNSSTTVVERAIAYLAKIPGAVSGCGGHAQTFDAARAVVYGFGLGVEVGLEILLTHYNPRCQPPWSEKELRHKCEEADTKPFEKSRDWLLEKENSHKSVPAATSGSDRLTELLPAVLVTPEESRVVEEVLPLLAKDPDIYQRSSSLVMIEPSEIGLLIKGVDEFDARRRITERVTLIKEKVTKEGDRYFEQIHPPSWLAKMIMSHPTKTGVRKLRGTTTFPIIKPNGELAEPGYDATTELHATVSSDVIEACRGISATQENAQQAAKDLLDLLCDFPVSAPHGKSVVLSAILTILARHLIDGPTPLHHIDASTAGSGKDLLQKIIGLTTLGMKLPVKTFSADPVEFRKAMTTIAKEGESTVFWDNLQSGSMLGSPVLDAALTATFWSDRILGESSSITARVLTTWISSGNNISFRGDTARRTIRIRLEPIDARPEDRTDFKYPHLEEHVRQHRHRYLANAMMMLLAFIRAGKPKTPNVVPTGSFGAWDETVRHCLLWCDLSDPWQSVVEGRSEGDSDAAEFLLLLNAWEEATEGKPMTAAAVAKRFESQIDAAIDSYPLLTELITDRRGKASSEIGYLLRKHKGRIAPDGRRLMGSETRRGVNEWRVQIANDLRFKR